MPTEVLADYEQYFQGLRGTAVFFSTRESTYYIYRQELANMPSSPCSSFKIISCLIGLENGAIDPEKSTMEWNGTIYPMREWNQNLDYKQAFESSCIWYYRRVIDSVGKEYVQDILDSLDYGNRDISQWEGSMNNLIFPDMKDLEELNGFWQESSLQISPMQQVDVIRRIFDNRDIFSEHTLDLMKEVMLIDNNGAGMRIYGKTGSGKDENNQDAWFVGMFDKDDDVNYFAVRLNEPDIYGAKAKEVAINIIRGEFSNEAAD